MLAQQGARGMRVRQAVDENYWRNNAANVCKLWRQWSAESIEIEWQEILCQVNENTRIAASSIPLISLRVCILHWRGCPAFLAIIDDRWQSPPHYATCHFTSFPNYWLKWREKCVSIWWQLKLKTPMRMWERCKQKCHVHERQREKCVKHGQVDIESASEWN